MATTSVFVTAAGVENVQKPAAPRTRTRLRVNSWFDIIGEGLVWGFLVLAAGVWLILDSDTVVGDRLPELAILLIGLSTVTFGLWLLLRSRNLHRPRR